MGFGRHALLLGILAGSPLAHADWEVVRPGFDEGVVRELKARLARNPHDAYALQKLTGLYRRHRNLDQLATELAGSPVALGELERSRGNWPRAVELLRAAPPSWETEVALGSCYLQLKREGDARDAYQRALSLAPEAHRAAILRQLCALDLSPELKAASLRQLLRLVPGDAAVRSQLVSLLVQLKLPREALAVLDAQVEALARDPGKRAELWIEEGELFEALGETAKAEEVYAKAYRGVPQGHPLARQALERTAAIYRRKDERRALAQIWERDWPVGRRGFLEWDLLARLYDELGDPARAEECFRKALGQDPHALDARRRLITLYERQGRGAEVIAEYRRLVQAAPGEPRFRLELAERLRKESGGTKEALALCEQVGAQTRDPSIHAALAELYTRWGLYPRALAERERLVRLEPDDETHLVNLGELYSQRGQLARANSTWLRILSLPGKREQRLARLAEVYAEHNKNDESLELYQKAAQLAPSDPGIARGLGSALDRLHRDEEAERVWETLFRRALAEKKRSEALELRQRLLAAVARRGLLASALAGYRARFIAAADDFSASGWALAAVDCALRLSRATEAELLLRQLARRATDPEVKADAFIGLAQVAHARHQIAQQIAALEKAAELSPARARELYAQVAALSLELYRDNDALTYARRAIALGPPDVQAQLRLAEVLEKREQIVEAIAAYQRALEIDDRQWKTRFVLARLHLRRGEHQEAARLYREVIRRAPDEELVLDATRRAIDLEEYLGALGELEREVEPLAYAHPEKRVYRNLLVDLYQRHAASLLRTARTLASRQELERVGEHALAPLLEVLVDGEQPDARRAIALLAELGNQAAAAPLLKLALPASTEPPPPARDRERGIDLRVDAALAGARLATAKEVPALLKLAADPEKHVRLAALYGLARVGRPAADPQLRALLDDERAPAEAQALACAAFAIDVRAAARALPLLVKIAGDRSRSEVARESCVLALGAVGAHGGERILPPSTRSVLEGILQAADEGLEARAAWALGALGGRPSARALTTALFVKPEPVRQAAAAALGRGDTRQEPQLDWPDPRRRADGLDVPAWIEGARDRSESAPPLFRAELEPEIVTGVLEGLGRHRDLALRTLGDLDEVPTSLSLGPLGPGTLSGAAVARLLPALEKWATAGDALVRARVAPVLGKVPGGGRALAALARDGDSSVRQAALSALWSSGPVESGGKAALLTALAAPAWRERQTAALLVARHRAPLGESRIDAALERLLDDPSGFVREAAALALGRAGHDRPASAPSALRRHRADESPEVGAAIDAALSSL